jgi:hypothetical protein
MLNAFLIWIRHLLCSTASPGTPLDKCCDSLTEPLSDVAMSMVPFGFWMVALGSSFILLPLLGERALLQRVRNIAAASGFPREAGLWSEVFGVALASFGLFYFAAALFEVYTFFWMSVFGRLGVFAICVVLSWRHQLRFDAAGQPRPNKLLFLALPDLVFGTLTACLLLPDYLSRIVFLLGVADLVTCLGFFTFPEWLAQLFGVRAKADTWNVVLGALMAFFSIYGMAAALLAMAPIAWVAVYARILLAGALWLNWQFRSSRVCGTTKPGKQFSTAVFIEFVVAVSPLFRFGN